MASSDNTNSISSSHSIPFSKTSSHIDAFQDMTAFTPPADSWIIRYPTGRKSQPSKEEKPIPAPEANKLEDPCRKYLQGSEIAVKSFVPLGTDDHFKSAVCSKNLLKVCETLMNSKGFTPKEDHDADDFEELSLMNEKSRMDFYRKRHGNRRGSQSLPASPQAERKVFGAAEASGINTNINPYFTVPKAPEKKESISFLTSLFGITAAKPSEAMTANLTQKFEHDRAEVMASADEFNNKEMMAERTVKSTTKSNQYREMNIFSPTSM